MAHLFSSLGILMILGLGIGFFWLFPYLFVLLIYPVPFLFAFLIAFYGKLLLGFRLGRKELFAISNSALFVAIPLGVQYTRFGETQLFLYGFFHLFLSLPFCRYLEPPLFRIYERMDIFGELFHLFQKKQTRLLLSTLKAPLKALPSPKMLPMTDLPPEELYGFFWNLPGERVRWLLVEELSGIYLLKESEELIPLPEYLLEEEPLTLFFNQYPDLVLYGILLTEPLTINQVTYKNYVIYDIIPKYRGTRASPALPWQKVQSICKNFRLNKIGEMGAFKGEKIARLIPKYPSGVTSGYFRVWNPNDPEMNYYCSQSSQ